MNITILQGAFLPVPPMRGGAIEKAWYALGREFARSGHQVTHISRYCDGLPETELIDGVRHLRIKGRDACRNPFLLKLYELPYVLRARPVLPPADILVTHAFWAPLVLPRVKFGRLYVHVGRFPKGQLSLYSKASRLQVPSTAVAAAAKAQLPVDEQRICTLPYPLPFAFPELPLWQNRPKRAVYAGRIHPEKGVLEMVRAWGKLPAETARQWNLSIIGPWREAEGGAGAKFLQQVKEEAGENVEIREPIFNDNELRKEYLSSRVFLYPSAARKGETFGLAVLEAMSCGCVPLVSSLPCFQDFIVKGKNAHSFDDLSENREHAFLEALQNLLNQQDLEKLSREGVKTARTYELPSVAAQYLADFGSLCGD